MSAPRNGALPASDVARILDTARIPYVMFGLWPVGCHGTDHSTTEIDFVIDEDKIPAAATALVATGHFQRCADDNCLERTPDRRDRSGMFPGRLYPADVLARQMAPNNYHAIAQEHLHIGPGYEYFQVISLYAKSHLLWSFPDLTLDAGDPRTYMYTNDAQLPPRTQGGSTGPWDTLYPVKIPTHVALVEALCLLYLRDLGDFTHLHDTWSGMLNGALGQQFIDADLNLTERAKALRRNVNPRWLPGLDPFFFPTRAEPVFAGLNRLRATLLQNNELPDIPPHDLSDCPM